MNWYGPVLDVEQRALAAMLDEFTADRDPALDDAPEVAARLAGELARLGVWTLGTDEADGGGGADRATTMVAFERLGRSWPALGWAAVQAHAAVDLLGGDARFADLVRRLHAAQVGVAVVEASATHIRLSYQDGTVAGTVDRVDAAVPAPYLLLLVDDRSALLVPPTAMAVTPLRRTGFGGALTCALDVEAGAAAVEELVGVDVPGARTRLRLGAAAVAAGIAGAATDDARRYAASRRQFGDTLVAIPMVRQALLDQAARTSVVLGAVLSAAAEPVLTLAVLRDACDTAIDVAASALQIHGGYGYLAEYPVERRLRDALSLRAAVDVPGASAATARDLVGLDPVLVFGKDAS